MDAVTFTAGIGENGPALRSWICNRLTFLGARLDEDVNQKRLKTDRLISTPDSRIALAVVPTNEELMIARDTARLAAK